MVVKIVFSRSHAFSDCSLQDLMWGNYFRKPTGNILVPEIYDYVKPHQIHCKLLLDSATPSGQKRFRIFLLDSWKSNLRRRLNEKPLQWVQLFPADAFRQGPHCVMTATIDEGWLFKPWHWCGNQTLTRSIKVFSIVSFKKIMYWCSPVAKGGFWGLSPPKLKHETLQISWVYVNFQNVKPPAKTQSPPTETQSPLLKTFWRRFCIGASSKQKDPPFLTGHHKICAVVRFSWNQCLRCFEEPKWPLKVMA